MNNVQKTHSHTDERHCTKHSVKWNIDYQLKNLCHRIMLHVCGMKWKTETMLHTKALACMSVWFRFIKHCHTWPCSHVLCVCEEYINPQPTIVRQIIIESMLRYVSLHHFGASSICSFHIRAINLTRIKWNIDFAALRQAPFSSTINEIHKLNEVERLNKHLYHIYSECLNWGRNFHSTTKYEYEQTMRISQRKNLWLERWERHPILIFWQCILNF